MKCMNEITWVIVGLIHLGIAVLQHLTRVTNSIDIGAEFLYQASPMMPGRHIGITSFVAKYRGK
jgi:hypothetical protein